MILGGVNAAGRCVGGILRCGWNEAFLPCSATIVQPKIKAAIEQTTPVALRYTAWVRAWSGSAWVTIGAATYFQVTRNADGNLDTADVTVQQPEEWSPYRAGVNADLLKPSSRPVQIWCGMTYGGQTWSVSMFEGHITNYSEALGASGGGISLRLEDLRDSMQRTAATLPTINVSAFRLIQETMRYSPFPGGNSSAAMISYRVGDREMTTVGSWSMGGNDVLSSIRAAMSASGIPLFQITGAGELSIGLDDDNEQAVATVFDYSDKALITGTRNSGDGDYNTVRTYGLVGTTPTASEVSDAADVALRGKRYYAAGYVGAPWITLADANATALEFIAVSLRGKFSFEAPLNPFLRPGQTIGLQSDRLAIPASRAKIKNVNHQYSVGRARTYMRDVAPVPI